MVPIAVGQGQLLEPPPVRRVIVPRGHASWWGIDPSTQRVSVAYSASIDGEVRRDVRTVPFAPGEGPARLSAIYDATRAFVVQCVSLDYGAFPLPGVVLIEQPSGKMDNPNLSYAVGVIQAAVYDGLHDLLARAPHIETVTSSHWKKVACGRGDLYKPKSRSGYYEVLVWARRHGYAGSSWDEADAMGIADCARREIALEER